MKPSDLCFKVVQHWVENAQEFLVLLFGIQECAFPPFSLLRVVSDDAVSPWRVPCGHGYHKHKENTLRTSSLIPTHCSPRK